MSGYEQRSGDFRVICDFSGFTCWASQTVMTWDKRRVLRRFVGEETQRHPQDLVRSKPDRQTVPNPRPEQPDVFLSAEVTPVDL